jgi:FixJ family two-component response regulator
MPDALRIALVDDDAAVLDALRLYLERNGVLVSSFSTAEAFLAILGEARSNDPAEGDGRQIWARHVTAAARSG